MYSTVIEQKERLHERSEFPEHVLEKSASLDSPASSSEHQQCTPTILEKSTLSEELATPLETNSEYVNYFRFSLCRRSMSLMVLLYLDFLLFWDCSGYSFNMYLLLNSQ